MTRWHIACLFLLVTFVAVSIANGGTLQKKELSISIPEEWREIPRKVIDTEEQALKRNSPVFEGQHFDYGFQLDSSEQWFSYPRILIQVVANGRIPESELNKLQETPQYLSGEGFDTVREKIKSTGLHIQEGKRIYDKQQGIIWLRIESETPSTHITILSAMIPTEEGEIRVHCYSLTKDYNTYEPLFTSMAESVTPIPSLAYKTRAVGWDFNWDFKWGKIISAALAAVVIGLLLAFGSVVKSLFRNKHEKKPPPTNTPQEQD